MFADALWDIMHKSYTNYFPMNGLKLKSPLLYPEKMGLFPAYKKIIVRIQPMGASTIRNPLA